MKKTLSTFIFAAALLFANLVSAQSVQEGVTHLYAERTQSAKAVFDKLIAANPNNIEATYWLGQTNLAMGNIAGARAVYDRALMSNGNAPLLLVGMGHVELLENNASAANQRFETAISLSKGKKGDDPMILSAVGRAHVDAAGTKVKTGNLQYAVEKLKLAAERDPKNPDIYLNLGNAYRKLLDGGNAVQAYNKALEVSPNFGIAAYRIAKIYETQDNWEPYVNQLNIAIQRDPKFAPAYYEMYYYNLGKLDFNGADEYARKYIANSDNDPQNDYLRAQTEWAKKNYDAAIQIANTIISNAGPQARPRTYKLLAYSYVGKGDTIGARQFIDQYFDKANQDEVIPQDLILKAEIYAALPDNPNPNIIRDSYLQAASLDTVLSNKIKLLQQGVDKFKASGKRLAEAELRMAIYDIKPNAKPQELYFIGEPLYRGRDFRRADSVFNEYAKALPDSIFGHFWSARSRAQMDTSMEKGLAVPAYRNTLEVALRNGTRFRTMGIESAGYLATYHNNILKNRDSAIFYIDKGLTIDPTNENLMNTKKILSAAPKPQKSAGNGTKSAGQKPSAIIKKSPANTSTARVKK